MLLVVCFVAAHLIGRQMGWWGPLFSSSGALPRTPGGSGGGRSGGRGGGGGGGGRGRSSGGSSSSSGGGNGRVAHGVGSAGGHLAGWNDARRDARRDGARWGSWREAMADGYGQGKVRGRERFEVGQERKAERAQQAQWWDHAKQRSGFPGLVGGRGLRGWWHEHVQRKHTCPGCGHGNELNDSRQACPCDRDGCACGTDAAPVTRDDENTMWDYSLPAERDEARVAPNPLEKPAPAAPGAPLAPVTHLTKTTTPQPDPDCDPATAAPHPMEDTVTAPTAPSPEVSGEVVNLTTTRTSLTAISSKMSGVAEQMIEVRREAEDVVKACDNLTDGLSALDMDPETLANISALREQAQKALKEAQEAEADCTEASAMSLTVISGIDARHGAIEEAVQSSTHPAQMQAYKAA